MGRPFLTPAALRSVPANRFEPCSERRFAAKLRPLFPSSLKSDRCDVFGASPISDEASEARQEPVVSLFVEILEDVLIRDRIRRSVVGHVPSPLWRTRS